MIKTMVWSKIAFFLLLQAQAYAADAVAEVLLKALLDEKRGYCIDALGSQTKADISRPLQAHSCYSYQGRVAVDQGFEAIKLKAGAFRLTYFNVCMSGSPREGGILTLAPCSDDPAMKFVWLPSGEIRPRDASYLCITVADGSGMPGNGGSPVHLKRNLSLEKCDTSRAAYQTWRYRASFDKISPE